MDAIADQFGVDCLEIICDNLGKSTNLLKNQEKMIQIVTKTNISAVFKSFESKSHCAYFINILDKGEVKKVFQEIFERAPNVFQKFPWFIMSSEFGSGAPELGVKLQFDSNINLLEHSGDQFHLHELYALGDQVIFSKIGSYEEEKLKIQNLDKLGRRRDLQGITLR